MTTDGATPSPTLADRLAGAVWGHLVGDAIGVPYEFRPPAAIGDVRFGERGTHGQPPGTWSDDGALMLALLDSLLTCGLRTDGNRTDWTYDPAIGFDVADQGRRIVAWQDEGRYTPDGDGSFDIGGTTARAIDALRRGVPAEETGPTHDRACGNGSLMRILPLALVERDVPDDVLVDHAHRASAVTHGHVRCQATCAWYVLTARRLLEGEPDPAVAFEAGRAALGRAYDAMGDAGSGYRDALAFVAGWRATHEPAGGGAAWDALWSARTAIESAGSYRETVERAIRLGDDTDTTAAIAGGLAGARWGIDAIPDGWLGGMRAGSGSISMSTRSSSSWRIGSSRSAACPTLSRRSRPRGSRRSASRSSTPTWRPTRRSRRIRAARETSSTPWRAGLATGRRSSSCVAAASTGAGRSAGSSSAISGWTATVPSRWSGGRVAARSSGRTRRRSCGRGGAVRDQRHSRPCPAPPTLAP